MENPIKVDDLGVPLFSETLIHTSRWWFQIFFIFAPKMVKISNLTNSYFSDGLKPPTRLLYESLKHLACD